MLEVNPQIRIPMAELRFTFARSSGPGGQNVNKLNTKATLRWGVAASPSLPDEVRSRLMRNERKRITSEGELLVTSQRYRDQGRNVADCLDKLREMIAAAAIRPKRRRPTRPGRAAVERRLESKHRQAAKKQRRRDRRQDD